MGYRTMTKEQWDTDINKSLKEYITAAENVYHACRAMAEEVCQDFDVAHLGDASNLLLIEAHESEQKMQRAMKDYRLSQVI